jgi:hypothetical protein
VEEEVDIDLGGAEHVSDGHPLVLQLQQLLREKHTHFSNNHGCGVAQIGCSVGQIGSDVTQIGCGVAQIRLRRGSDSSPSARLALRQARERISARNLRGGPLPSGSNEDNKSGTL